LKLRHAKLRLIEQHLAVLRQVHTLLVEGDRLVQRQAALVEAADHLF